MNFRGALLLLIIFGVTYSATYDSRLIVTNSARTLGKGRYTIGTRVSPATSQGAGVIGSFSVGLTNSLTLGVSYGGDGIIGRDDVEWYPWPGAIIKYQLFTEKERRWSIALGVDIQGFGGNASGYKGFLYKSQGFFVTGSRSYRMFGKLTTGLHLGVNYSFEDLEEVHWPNFTVTTDLRFNKEVSLLLEYDFATNQLDNDEEADRYWHAHRGFLNVGLHWRFIPQLKLEVNVLDLFSQRLRSYGQDDDDTYGWGREIKLTYYSKF